MLVNLPPEIQGPSAWYGTDLARQSDWIEHLTPTELSEVESAASLLASEARDIVDIRKEDFPLPTLSARLERVTEEVLNGRGFALLRALPVERWTQYQAATAFFGIGAHI